MATETTPSPAQLRADLDERGVEFVFAQFVDMHGKPSAKLVPVSHLEGLFEDGAGFAGFAAGDIGQGPHDPDIAAMPDPRTLTLLPWKPGIARFACDITVEGEEWPFCPRTILRNQLARAKELGFDFKIGCELEYFLVRKREDGTIELADPLDDLEQPCYDMRALTRNLGFVTEVARHVDTLGWGHYATDHEDANGQFEQNFQFDDALVTCDRAIFFRYMVESLAQERGLLATFMPKPFSHLTGNGAHFHMSLWEGDRNVFATGEGDDPRGLGLSKQGYHFLGGLLAHAQAYIAVTAPTVNSYKRLKVGDPRSGATWAPNTVTWTGNNRTHMVRVPGPGRFELRLPDGAANPYLMQAVILAAGLDGVRTSADPGPRHDIDMYRDGHTVKGAPRLPLNLLDALRAYDEDDTLKAMMGEEFSRAYVKLKTDEWNSYCSHFSEWERENTLDI